MTITLLNTPETYNSLQSFQSIEQMNTAVKQHKKLVASNKHKNIYRVLDLISQYSCVYVGVSWLTINRIGDLLDLSYKTVQRALDRLVALSIIKKYACKRVSGDKRQTSNIYVIQPIAPDANECDLPQVTDQKTPSKSSKSNNTDDTKMVENKNKLKKGLLNKLPSTLAHALTVFSDDANELYALAGTCFKAKASISKDIRMEDNESEYYNAILSVFSTFKRGKVRSLHGLIYHAIKAVTRSVWLKSQLNNAFGF